MIMAMIADDFSVVPIAFTIVTVTACAGLSARLMDIPANGSGVVRLIIVGAGIITSIALGIVFRRSEYLEVMWICASWLLFALIALLASGLVWLVVRFV